MNNFYNPYMAMQPQRTTNDIQYVNGLESAKAFPMNPNSSVILMDSGEPKFYVKRTDASGFSDVKTYVFTEYQETPMQEKYVSREEFEELKRLIEKKRSAEK